MTKKQNDLVITQAQRVYAKFGGAAALLRALDAIGKPRHRWTVESWGRPKEAYGTGGIIPSHNWPDLLRAAKHAGVALTEKDMDPRPAVYEVGDDGRKRRKT